MSFFAMPGYPGEPRSAPDCSQIHFGTTRRISSPPLFPTGPAWGALGSSEMPQTAARAIFEHDPTDFISSPPLCFRLVRPGVPWGAQKCPRLQPELFWEDPTDFFHPPPCFRLVRPGVPWGAQKCPRLQPELFLRESDGFIPPPVSDWYLR